jgi:hypothetical protein
MITFFKLPNPLQYVIIKKMKSFDLLTKYNILTVCKKIKEIAFETLFYYSKNIIVSILCFTDYYYYILSFNEYNKELYICNREGSEIQQLDLQMDNDAHNIKTQYNVRASKMSVFENNIFFIWKFDITLSVKVLNLITNKISTMIQINNKVHDSMFEYNENLVGVTYNEKINCLFVLEKRSTIRKIDLKTISILWSNNQYEIDSI